LIIRRTFDKEKQENRGGGRKGGQLCSENELKATHPRNNNKKRREEGATNGNTKNLHKEKKKERTGKVVSAGILERSKRK